MAEMSDPIPLWELLEYEGGEVYRSDETEVCLHEMARRLRKLRELCGEPLTDHMLAASHILQILEGK